MHSLPVLISLTPACITAVRDIKPENLVLGKAGSEVARKLHLIDFGTAESLVDRNGSGFAMLRGTLLHEYMALVEWFEDGPPSADSMESVDRRIAMQIGRPLSEEERRSGREAFTSALTHPAVVQRMSRTAYGGESHDHLEVCNELPFIVKTEVGEFNGRIDRLVIGRRDGVAIWADLIDFKSDAASLETLSEVQDRYRSQLDDYRRAVQVMLDLSPEQVSLFLEKRRRAACITPVVYT